MRTPLSLMILALFLAACGGGDKQTESAGAAPAGTRSSAVPAGGDSAQPAAAVPAAGAPAGRGAFAGRTGELTNPENSTMVFLYYDLAGLTPPIDTWVEEDNRVQYAPAIDKPALRKTIKAELEAGAAAVRNAGLVRLSMNANLSDYDPSYGEFTVRALAPSSVVTFDAFKQKVELKFGNGRTAQIWRVTAAEAQAIRDKLGYNRYNVPMDVLVSIASVQPGPGGGTITADVLEYELREGSGGQTLGRVKVAP